MTRTLGTCYSLVTRTLATRYSRVTRTPATLTREWRPVTRGRYLFQEARFLNFWMRDAAFTLDQMTQIPRYVPQDTYQTVLDDKSGYNHFLLDEKSRTYLGFQWGGWYFLYNSIPFGWKLSPFIYQSTDLVVTHYLGSIGLPCSLYIHDIHNGQQQIN